MIELIYLDVLFQGHVFSSPGDCGKNTWASFLLNAITCRKSDIFMREIVARLSLGLTLITIASGILLLSDRPRRNESAQSTATMTKKVALLQMASQPIMEDGAVGVIEALRANGFNLRQNLELKRYNAEGSVDTANSMALEVTSRDYDLVVTLSTPCLQIVANVNQQRRVPHVFGMVADPQASGVGVGAEPLEHPAHLVGIGTLPPAAESLTLAKQINPQLKRVGVVWNPAEVNSVICTKLAREVCRELEIELLEANADNTAAVKEAAVSLIARGIDALWIGGDVTVLAAVEVVVKSAADAGLPVFTCIPGNALKGTLFDVGANYQEVGRLTGQLSARVLKGEAIASLPVTRIVPPKLVLNLQAVERFPQWKFSAELQSQADTLVDAQGERPGPKAAKQDAANNANSTMRTAPLKTTAVVNVVSYTDTPDTEEALAGLQEGLKRAGLQAGRDYTWQVGNAQGDIAALNSLVDAAVSRQSDLILTISSQALQCAIQRSRSTPIVFTMVANPFLAQAGRSDADHHPLVTGAYGANDVEAIIPILRQLLPQARRIGALYVPGEVNSVYSHDLLVAAAKRHDFELISLPINTAAEVSDAAQSLCGRGIDGLCLPNSNLVGASFPSIAKAAQQAKLPVFAFRGGLAKQGAAVVVSRDYFDMGVDAGQLAARVLRGERPAAIPFHESTVNRLWLNPTAAAACGITLPQSLLEQSDHVVRPQ